MTHDLYSIKRLAQTVHARALEMQEAAKVLDPYQARFDEAWNDLCDAAEEYAGKPVGYLFDSVFPEDWDFPGDVVEMIGEGVKICRHDFGDEDED